MVGRSSRLAFVYLIFRCCVCWIQICLDSRRHACAHGCASLCLPCHWINISLISKPLPTQRWHITNWGRFVSIAAGRFFGHLACLSNLEDLQLGKTFDFDFCYKNQPPDLSLNSQEVQQLHPLTRLRSLASWPPSFSFVLLCISKIRLEPKTCSRLSYSNLYQTAIWESNACLTCHPVLKCDAEQARHTRIYDPALLS